MRKNAEKPVSLTGPTSPAARALLARALRSRHLVIHVMGPHAGEPSECIFLRKRMDIERIGRTYWYNESARPPAVKEFASSARSGGRFTYVVFIGGSRAGQTDGGGPTKTRNRASHFSAESQDGKWQSLPAGIGPVTGRMGRAGAALVFDRLEVITESKPLDLREWTPKAHARVSAWCARRLARPAGDRRPREIVGVARLKRPFGVWLRGDVTGSGATR